MTDPHVLVVQRKAELLSVLSAKVAEQPLTGPDRNIDVLPATGREGFNPSPHTTE